MQKSTISVLQSDRVFHSNSAGVYGTPDLVKYQGGYCITSLQ